MGSEPSHPSRADTRRTTRPGSFRLLRRHFVRLVTVDIPVNRIDRPAERLDQSDRINGFLSTTDRLWTTSTSHDIPTMARRSGLIL